MIRTCATSIADGYRDIHAGLVRYHLIGTLGWQDVATRYRRSRIGAFWLTINMAVLIVSIGFLFGRLFGQPLDDFLPYLAVGQIIWGFMATCISDGCGAFSSSSGIVLQVRMPLSVHVARALWSNLIILGHNLLIIPLVFLFFLKPVSPVALLAIPGFLVLLVNVAWMMLMAGVVCARFRDVSQIVQNAMQVLYFLTPIMWTAETMQGRVGTLILNLNPFNSLLDIVRSPILGQYPETLHWIIAVAMAVVGWLATLIFFGNRLKRLAYWL